ncbi:MAG: hypothetical protein L0I62_04050 [Gammaproteobacteria bacterium]|nr:hypothetical protein [Gammaproteobacteria bacterium]
MRFDVRKAVLAAALAAPLLLWGAGERAAAAPESPIEVIRLVPAQPSQVAPSEVSVLVFFDFNQASKTLFERLALWAKNVGGHVVLDRELVMAPGPAPLARAFVVARTLGVTDAVLPALFELAARQPPRETQQAFSGAEPPIKPAIADIFRSVGINEIEFNAAWDSKLSDAGLRRARAMAERFQIHAAPVIVVNGLWKLVPMAGASANNLVDALNGKMNRVIVQTSAERE